jgi:hypothetical protein
MSSTLEILNRDKLFVWTYIDSQTDIMSVVGGWVLRTKIHENKLSGGTPFVEQTFIPDTRK